MRGPSTWRVGPANRVPPGQGVRSQEQAVSDSSYAGMESFERVAHGVQRVQELMGSRLDEDGEVDHGIETLTGEVHFDS